MRSFRPTTSALIVAVSVFAGLTMSAKADVPYFTGLGFLPNGDESRAHGVSGDGISIVGWGNGIGSGAFRWTAANGLAQVEQLWSLNGPGDSAVVVFGQKS